MESKRAWCQVMEAVVVWAFEASVEISCSSFRVWQSGPRE